MSHGDVPGAAARHRAPRARRAGLRRRRGRAADADGRAARHRVRHRRTARCPRCGSRRVGHGAGTRDTPGRPNVLRLIVGEEAAGAGRARAGAGDRDRRHVAAALRPAHGAAAGRGRARRVPDADPDEEGPARGCWSPCSRPPSRRAAARGGPLHGDDHARRAPAGVGPHDARARGASPVETAVRRRSASRWAGAAAGSTTRSRSSRTASRVAEARGVPVKEVWAAALAAYRSAGERGR